MSVGEIDPPRDLIQRNDLAGGPLLDGEVLDVDVTSPLGRFTGVGKVAAGYVVTVDLGWAGLLDAKLVEDGAEVLDGLGTVDGGHEFRLGRHPFCLVVDG